MSKLLLVLFTVMMTLTFTFATVESCADGAPLGGVLEIEDTLSVADVVPCNEAIACRLTCSPTICDQDEMLKKIGVLKPVDNKILALSATKIGMNLQHVDTQISIGNIFNPTYKAVNQLPILPKKDADIHIWLDYNHGTSTDDKTIDEAARQYVCVERAHQNSDKEATISAVVDKYLAGDVPAGATEKINREVTYLAAVNTYCADGSMAEATLSDKVIKYLQDNNLYNAYKNSMKKWFKQMTHEERVTYLMVVKRIYNLYDNSPVCNCLDATYFYPHYTADQKRARVDALKAKCRSIICIPPKFSKGKGKGSGIAPKVTKVSKIGSKKFSNAKSVKGKSIKTIKGKSVKTIKGKSVKATKGKVTKGKSKNFIKKL